MTKSSAEGSSATQSPYQLDIDQTLRASQALLRHCQTEAKRLQEQSSKIDILQAAGSDDESEGGALLGDDQPIWLTLTTKQHIVDRNRLKANKVHVPHSLNTSQNLSICLITADPQRSVKNIVADPTFPQDLLSRISKIIGYAKLKARYQPFEKRRQLLSEYDVFLADDRIVSRLPETLGKVFYKSTAKRPIPIQIAYQERTDGKRVKQQDHKKGPKDARSALFASPTIVAKEIESTLGAVPIYLKPGTNVAIRVGLASFTPQQLSENIEVVVRAVIEKHVVKGWRNVKSIQIKSPTSMAMPIWMADDMWVGDDNVVQGSTENGQHTPIEGSKLQNKRKRNPSSKSGPQAGERKRTRTTQEATASLEKDADRAAAAARKANLAQQKSKAFKDDVAVTEVATTA